MSRRLSDDLHTFTGTRRRLRILADIRIPQVKGLTRFTLERAFHRVKEDTALSKGLNEDFFSHPSAGVTRLR